MPTTCPTRVPARATTTLVAAARVVYLHDVVASLPKGYDTLVAERGHRLSTVLAADLIVELDRLGHGERRPTTRMRLMAMLTLLSTHTEEVVVMAALTVRGLDDETKARLRVRAAQNGRSMEAEVRAILQASLSEQPTFGRLGTRIHERFAAEGGVDLDLPPRSETPRAAVFEA